jgi:hypothetical protein
MACRQNARAVRFGIDEWPSQVLAFRHGAEMRMAPNKQTRTRNKRQCHGSSYDCFKPILNATRRPGQSPAAWVDRFTAKGGSGRGKDDGSSNSYSRIGYRRTVYSSRAFLHLPSGVGPRCVCRNALARHRGPTRVAHVEPSAPVIGCKSCSVSLLTRRLVPVRPLVRSPTRMPPSRAQWQW